MSTKKFTLALLLIIPTFISSCGDIVPYTSVSNSALVAQNKNVKDIQQASIFFKPLQSPSNSPIPSSSVLPSPNASSLLVIQPESSKNISTGFKFINKGKFNDNIFPIGAKKSEILSKLGTPNNKGGIGGTDWFTFDKITYFTDVENKNVAILVTGEGFDIEGLKLGATISQIKERFGKPNFEGIYKDDIGDDIFGDGIYLIKFDIENKYILTFAIDSKTKTKSTEVYLSKKHFE